MAGTDLFTHIRHMMWTTTPSLVLAILLFAAVGWFAPAPKETHDLDVFLQALEAQFAIGPHLLIPAALVLILVKQRMPAFPALLIGALTGGLFAVFFQQRAVLTYVGETDLPRAITLLKGCWMAMFQGFTLSSGNAALDSLLSRGGMASMLNTIWLIMSAMMFGAVMETTRMLEKIAATILGFVRGTGTLISATLATSLGMNIVASDQYIAIVIPGRMFRAEYQKRRLHPKNLSRALEDAGTLTSALVPWNTCGAFMAQTLGVATFSYLPYCFFNLLNPFVSAIYGFAGFTIDKLPEEEVEEAVA
jgi:NhaC family Na+:H+ antiporter